MPAWNYTAMDDYRGVITTSINLVLPSEWWRESGQWHMAVYAPKWMLEDIERELADNKGVLTDLRDGHLVIAFCPPNVVAAREATS